MSYLFLCSIGPVQDFIAAARSSRDLAYGSWLLSELAKTAARTIAEQEGFEALIFPTPASRDDLRPNSNLSVANKVVAVVRGNPQTLAKSVEEALRRHIRQVWQSVEDRLGRDLDTTLARRQLEDLIEFYWVAVPFEGEEGYTAARDLGEAALNARKATRNFVPYQGVSRFKSSIDGWREHVLALVPDHASRPNAQQMRRYKLRNGELLSGVDLLKRWGDLPTVKRYKSVSHIAALPFAEGVGEKADELWEALVNLFRKEEISSFADDYSVFFPAEVCAVFDDKEKTRKVLQAQEDILTQYAGHKRPSPYYALLLADGDSMGKAIDAQKTPDAHRKLSQALSAFAQQVPDIVEKHKGVPVYAGGDDVLAYLPLHTALNCVRELADTFATTMKNFVFEDERGNKHPPTLSAGLVITHHLEPLRDVLNLVRSAEKQAKAVAGKNALAITLNKRSGTDRTVKDTLSRLVERLNTMAQWWLDGTLSKGTAYELEYLAREMKNILQKEDDVLPEDALRAEAIRILKRKRESGGGEQVTQTVIQQLEEWLKQIALGDLAQEMIIANEFARAYKQAQPKQV